MQHSCERNRNQAKANIYPTNPTNYKPPGIGQIKTNGVMFGEIMMTDDGYGHCVKTFTDLYQCKGVPVGYTGNKKENQNFQECKNWWDPKTPECKSCKLAFPNIQIQSFRVWVAQDTGHFFYNRVQYIDINGNLGPVDNYGNLLEFDTKIC